jgi:glycerate 2-kinase
MNVPRKPNLKVFLRALYEAALSGADPGRAVTQALERPAVARALAPARRLGVFAVGKAAALMLEAAPRSDAALAILPRGYAPPRRRAEVLFASHPHPDRASVAAARRAVSFFQSFGPEDVILCLVSGGTSALLCLPRAGLTLADKRAAIERLMSSGASIVEVNRLRRRLSAVKGGKLGASTRARLVTLVLSDVPGDDPALVGSGPTVRGRRGDVVLVVGSNRMGLESAAHAASGRSFAPRLLRRRLKGEAAEAGRRFAAAARRLPPGGVLLAGGETTVTLGRRPGRGGRNLEFALGAAEVLDGVEGIALLAAGSDGLDGSSRAAGAFADGQTRTRALRRGLDCERALARHDTEPFFAALGDLFVTGPTGTNVGDWVFAIRRR